MAAECKPIEEMRIAIRHTAAHAMVRQAQPYVVAAPITLRVELGRPDQIDRALRVPGSTRVDGVTIEWTGSDMVSVYQPSAPSRVWVEVRQSLRVSILIGVASFQPRSRRHATKQSLARSRRC